MPTQTKRFLVSSTLSLAACLGVALAPVPAGTIPTQNFCRSHDDAALSTWPFWTCDNDKEAIKICKAIGKQCKKRVNIAHKCLLAQLKAEIAVDKAECGLSVEPNAKQCKSDVKSAMKAQKGLEGNAKQAALGQCEVLTQNCINTCDF